MTLEEAVEVLNREEHRGCPNWRISRHHTFDAPLRVVSESNEHLFEFEAFAVAKEYRRTGCMALGEAAAILNAHRHRGNDDWVVKDGPETVPLVISVGCRIDVLEEFEAIAIAQRYVDGVVERALVA